MLRSKSKSWSGVLFCLISIIMVFSGNLWAKEVKKVVVTDYFFSFHHNDGRPLNVALIEEIGAEEGFEVEVIETDGDFTRNSLDGADVLVLQNLTQSKDMNSNAKAAIEEFHKAGGGIFMLHGTLDVFAWSYIQENGIYGNYVQHSAANIAADVLIDDEAYNEQNEIHPMLYGIDKFNNVDISGRISGWKEEWFNWNNYFRGNEGVKILLSMDLASYTCACDIDDHPALWITDKEDGTGRMSYFLTGHGIPIHETGKDAGMKQIWRNSLLYLGQEDPRPGCCKVPGYENSDTNCVGVHVQDSCGTVSVKPTRVSNPHITFTNQYVDIRDLGPHSIDIRNISGESVFSQTGVDFFQYKINHLNPGVYFVNVKTNNVVKKERVVVY
ncbi:MAG: ThuA domain-containing protein [Fibrobacteria bacterium]|nr:ThuA domain-containing protein [Fibrobacteria bacterium]